MKTKIKKLLLNFIFWASIVFIFVITLGLYTSLKNGTFQSSGLTMYFIHLDSIKSFNLVIYGLIISAILIVVSKLMLEAKR